MIFTVIVFLLVLSVLVFVHELGHFWTARRFGVKAEEFGFGFPPRAWGFYRSKEGRWKTVRGAAEVEDAVDTVYSVNWIPLGGFVKIKGENGDSVDPDSFSAHPIWQRVIILSAGVTMNVVLAAAIISVCFMFGMPQSLDNVSPSAKVENKQIQVVQVINDSPAEKAGIEVGDIIEGIDGRRFENYDTLRDYVADRTGKSLEYGLKRGDKEFKQAITPELMESTGKGGIGVALSETGIVRYPWYLALWEGLRSTGILVWAVIVAFFELFKNLVMGHGTGGDLAGPVKIASMTGQVARMGLVYLLQFTAMLSINLAVINFLPIPALDGGRVIFLLIEKIKRKPVRQEVEAALHNIFFILLMCLVLFITVREIAGLAIIKAIWHKII